MKAHIMFVDDDTLMLRMQRNAFAEFCEAETIRCQHQRYDGGGSQPGCELQGDKIPLSSQIR